MKKIIALLLSAALLLPLAACTGTASGTTTAASTTEPTLPPTEPPPTTPPATEPPAPQLSDGERIALLLSELEAVTALTFSGELALTLPPPSEGETSRSDRYSVEGLLGSEGLTASGLKNGEAAISALLSGMTLTYTEGGSETVYTAAELLGRIPELATNLDRADRALQNLVHYLITYGKVVDGWLAKQDISLTAEDLLAALDLVIKLASDLAAEVGYEMKAALPSPSQGDLRKLIPQLVTLSPLEDGGYSVSFDLDPLISLLREMLSVLSGKLDQTVGALLDSAFGEGTASDILMRLGVIAGSDKLSLLTAEIEKLVLTARLTMDDFYAIASALISENLTVGVTASELKSILRENRNKTVDSLIARFAPKETYASLIERIASLFASTPSALYEKIAPEGSPTLSEQLSELDALLADADAHLSLALVLETSPEMKPRGLSISLSLSFPAFFAALALSAKPTSAE